MPADLCDMNSRERVEAALQHRRPDRTPIFEYVMHSAVAEAFLGRPFADDSPVFLSLVESEGVEAAAGQRARDLLDLAALFGFDMLHVPQRPTRRPPAPAPRPDDPVEDVRRRADETEAAPEQLSDEQRLQFVAIREEMARRGVDLPMLSSAGTHGVWDDVALMQTMALAPEVAERLFAARTRQALAFVDAYRALGVEHIGVGGDFSGNRPILSAEMYRRFIVPKVRQVSRRIHELGGYAINASDGSLWYVIDDFLFGCEADGYVEIDGQAGMDLRTLKQRFGDRITFYGNFDCMRVLSFGDAEQVRAHAVETIEAGLGSGGHILCANNAITASVPPANYLALQNAYREYFDLPPLAL